MKGGKPLKKGLMILLVMLLVTTTIACGRQAPIYTQGSQIEATSDPDKFIVNKAWLERESTGKEALLTALKQCRVGLK